MRYRTWFLAGALISAGCGQATEPELVFPELEHLEVDLSLLPVRAVRVNALPNDPEIARKEEARIPMVAIMDGDSEPIQLYPAYCHDTNGRFLCDAFVVRLADGTDPNSLAEHARAAEAHLLLPHLMSHTHAGHTAEGFVKVLVSPDRRQEVMREALAWPNVSGVELVRVGATAGAPSALDGWMTVIVGVDPDASPVPSDGYLQDNESRTLVVRYEGPGRIQEVEVPWG